MHDDFRPRQVAPDPRIANLGQGTHFSEDLTPRLFDAQRIVAVKYN